MFTYKKQEHNHYIILQDGQWFMSLDANFAHHEPRVQMIVSALNDQQKGVALLEGQPEEQAPTSEWLRTLQVWHGDGPL